MDHVLVTEWRLALHQRPTPALVAYARLLSAGDAELERLVERELAENPALERRDDAPAPVLPGTGPAVTATDPADEPGLLDDLASDARATLPAHDHPVLDHVLGSLDDHGFLPLTAAELARATGAPEARVEAVLALVRALGPSGFARHGTADFLDAQLRDLDAAPALVALARRLVADGLPELAAGRYGALARRFGVERDGIVAARDLLRRRTTPYPVLDRPLRRHGIDTARLPEVVVVEDGAELRVVLPEQERHALRVAPSYTGVAGAGAAAARRRGQAFLHRLEDRWATIRRVVERALDDQRAFVRHGPAALRPLTRAQVAAALGLHESTVSRVVAGRSALLPCGRVVALGDLFTARLAPQEALRRIVAEETRPRSDAELAAALAAAGHPVARRTVAKYRAAMDIAPCAQRSGEARFAPAAPDAKQRSPAPPAAAAGHGR